MAIYLDGRSQITVICSRMTMPIFRHSLRLISIVFDFEPRMNE